MNRFETILTGGRSFGKSFARDQWLSDQPLNSKIKMIYAHTNYVPAAIPAPEQPVNDPLELTDPQWAMKDHLERHGIKTREIHGKLYAYDEHWDTVKKIHGGEWVNATAWTPRSEEHTSELQSQR